MHDKRHTHPNWMILYLKPALKHGRQSCGEPCSSIDICRMARCMEGTQGSLLAWRAASLLLGRLLLLY